MFLLGISNGAILSSSWEKVCPYHEKWGQECNVVFSDSYNATAFIAFKFVFTLGWILNHSINATFIKYDNDCCCFPSNFPIRLILRIIHHKLNLISRLEKILYKTSLSDPLQIQSLAFGITT